MTGMIRRLALTVLLAVAGSASASLVLATESGAPEASAWPEVMTLQEASAFLRTPEAELAGLAASGDAPGRRIGAEWRFSRRALEAWLAADWRLVTVAVPPSRRPVALDDAALAATVGAGTAAAPATDGTAPPAANGGTSAAPIGEAPEEETAEQVFLRDERILLAPGAASLDLGFFYSRLDSDRLILTGAQPGLATEEQTFYTTSLLGRYGVAEDTEIFAGVVYGVEDSDIFAGGRNLGLTSDFDVGDARFGVRRTILREASWRPDVVLTLEGGAPLKNSSASLGAGLSFVKSYDPAVLFGSVNYRHTFSRDFADVTLLEPEDRIDATFGYALALNESLSLSSAVSGVFLFADDFTNARLRGQELFSLDFGLTARVAEGLYVEPSVAFGLNGPSDTFTLGLNIPYRF